MSCDKGKRLWRFRCNPVLPEVYDDALSYYEAICKLQKAIEEMGDEIDTGLIDFIKEAIPELVAEATYDENTDTLTLVLVDDVSDEQIVNDPVKRISVNGISRPVMDEIARSWVNASWLQNKKVCMYGDSTLVVSETYATKMRDSGVCESVDIRGVSGNTLTTQGLPLIQQATDLSDFDYVFVCYGINDWSGIAKYRFKNAVKSAIDIITSAGSEPVFVFPWTVYIPTLQSNGFINNFGCDMQSYVDAGIDVCEQNNVKYFNLCKIANVNENNYTSKLTRSSNGYYLHESNSLGDFICRAILNGNYCTGKCNAGRFTRPFRAFMPLNWAYNNYATASDMIGNVPVTFRKGRITTFTDVRVCEFQAISTGSKCRISGFHGSTATNGYLDFYYINRYNEDAGTIHICRVNDKADFDFVFSPPNDGGCWRLCAKASSGNTSIVFDLCVSSDDGDVRLTGYDPSDPAIIMIYNSDVTKIDDGYITATPDGSIRLSSFSVRVNRSYDAGDNVDVGNVNFYPQHNTYGTCRIGARTEHFRIGASGGVILQQLSDSLAANTVVIFDACDVTPSEFFRN